MTEFEERLLGILGNISDELNNIGGQLSNINTAVEGIELKTMHDAYGLGDVCNRLDEIVGKL
jgi:hypothetical protein